VTEYNGESDEEPDARFSLANERTFLAWNRTALALIAGGLAITQILPPFSIAGARRALGIPFIVLGGVIAFTSYARWEANERAMRAGRPLPPSILPRVLAFGVGAGAIVAGLLALFARQGS
jgi:putative membrane protein